MTTHYELLGLEAAATAEEIKRAFRREIARYHPDKVQHLGAEFQRLAADRAAELTTAYRILGDPAQREAYDRSLKDGAPAAPPSNPAPATPDAPPASEARPASDRPASKDRTAAVSNGFEFLRKATLARVRDAIQAAAAEVEPVQIPGFELAYNTQSKKGLFKRPAESQRLLVRLVTDVNPEAVADVWRLAQKAGTSGAAVCVLLMGPALSPQQDLAAAVSEQRRRSRAQGPVLVPVDVRDWEALFPPDTPAVARAAIQRLRAGA